MPLGAVEDVTDKTGGSMQKRQIAKLNITTSRLGFGAMRLPEQDGKINEPKAVEMLDYLHQNGVTYYDTAWFYHNSQSEPFVGRNLVERYPRDSFTVATKLPIDFCDKPEDMSRIFETQRKNLGLSCIDFYLMHGLDTASWEKAKRFGAPDFLKRLKDEGKIRFAGFSFHDKNEAFIPILDDFPWEFCQIQLNYADWYQRRADHLYDALAERGIPIILMEPVRGGGLSNLPSEMAAQLAERDPSASQASWALRFCDALPHVDVVLSGMSTLEQCRENVDIFSAARPLDQADQEALRSVAAAFDRLPTIPCTQCRYCASCPQNIDIEKLFRWYNNFQRFQDTWPLSFVYWNEVAEDKRASACIRCGQCEAACPQRIAVMDELQKVHQTAELLRK